MSEPDESRAPLLHPLFLGALALLAVNDHLLKPAFPGFLTGKLSDVAALVIVPPLAVELARVVGGRRRSAASPRRIAVGAGLLVALALVAVKLDPLANEAYAVALGLVQWPAALLVGAFDGAAFRPPLPAPTVMDPTDLIALPAAALGSWIAAGPRSVRLAWPREAGRFGRVGLAGAAVVVLAATSQAPPAVSTVVQGDEVVMSPGQAPIHRRRIVELRITAVSSSTPAEAQLVIDVEARARWPRVDPPARFMLSRVGPGGELEPAGGSRLSIDPGGCGDACTVEVDVAIDWPDAAGRPTSSIAWELAVTARAINGSLRGGMDISGEPALVTSDGDTGLLLGLLGLLPFAGVAIGGRRRDVPAPTGAGTWLDRVVAFAAALLVLGLAALPVIVAPPALEPAAGRVGLFAVALGPVLAIAAGVGLVRWWSGKGDLLAIVVLGTALVGLLFGARLIGQASETFFARGLQVAVGASILAAIVVAGAIARPDPPEPLGTMETEPASDGRVAVAGALVALTIGLLAAAPPLGMLMGVGVGTWWWSGRGHVLGLVCFVTGGTLAALLLLGGPTILGPRWTGFEEASIILAGLATFVGFLAALGVVGRHPARPVGKQPVDLAPATADPIAD